MSLPEQKKRVEIKKALARAELFWGIICRAGITTDLGGKILDGVAFGKLDDSEKILLVKVSTLLMKGAQDVESQFAKAEAEEKANQVDINESPQESPQESSEKEAISESPETIDAEIIETENPETAA